MTSRVGSLIFNSESNCELVIQFPPKMDDNWLRYELLNLGQIYETKLAEDVALCIHNTTSALNS